MVSFYHSRWCTHHYLYFQPTTKILTIYITILYLPAKYFALWQVCYFSIVGPFYAFLDVEFMHFQMRIVMPTLRSMLGKTYSLATPKLCNLHSSRAYYIILLSKMYVHIIEGNIMFDKMCISTTVLTETKSIELQYRILNKCLQHCKLMAWRWFSLPEVKTHFFYRTKSCSVALLAIKRLWQIVKKLIIIESQSNEM